MKSLRYVNSCPLTKSDWDIKTKQKNCSSSSANICLDSPTKPLVYHCVPNEDGVGYAEICSQVFYSLSKYEMHKKILSQLGENSYSKGTCNTILVLHLQMFRVKMILAINSIVRPLVGFYKHHC